MSGKGHNSGTVAAGKLKSFADRLTKLRSDFKEDCDTLLDDAEKGGIEKAALRRLVAWQGQDHVARAEREAIDDQYRFLAGDRATPGVLPVEGMLSQAVELYRNNAKVRTVAETLKVSTGKAHKLKSQASAFLVHVHADMNTAEPDHDLATGELKETADGPEAETHIDAAPADRGGEARGACQQDGRLDGDVGRASEARPDEVAAAGGERSEPGQRSAAESADAIRITPANGAAGTAKPVGQAAPPEPSLYQRITGAFADRPAGITPTIDDLTIPPFLRRAHP